jgi:hypothetical protein
MTIGGEMEMIRAYASAIAVSWPDCTAADGSLGGDEKSHSKSNFVCPFRIRSV